MEMLENPNALVIQPNNVLSQPGRTSLPVFPLTHRHDASAKIQVESEHILESLTDSQGS